MLVAAARTGLKRQRCWFVVTEFETVGAEIPDALGWNETTTILLPDGPVRHVAGHASAWSYARDNTWCFENRNEMCETWILLSALRRLSLSLGMREFERLVHLPYANRKKSVTSLDTVQR
ncbi:MAG: hypothetical protein QJR02_01460 [Sinobacteraceae bacterium]|nr:hypothetical protein [Nevskiaceae bacterium]